ncbi:MAG: tRNA 2-thiocytidine biosynthesis protein TtcA [Clostridia bacterium]|nr:tRNA 2-thiocytidine biosynthesis protein TtcA [Clostridia bacterium]
MERFEKIEKSILDAYREKIWDRFVSGIHKYELIKDGDSVCVCISGGKDSMLLAKLVEELQKNGDIQFEARYLVMDPGYNEINRRTIENNARLLNIPVHIFETEIFDSVVNVTDHPCYLCARMRRGYLYKEAQKLCCSKIALGHHFDDVIETILMGMLYGAQVQTMMPKLHSTNHPGMELIRPMYLVREEDIISWARDNDLHFIQCACRFTENIASKENEHLSKRQEMKNLIKDLRKINPEMEMNIFKSVENVELDNIIGCHDNENTYRFI